MKKALTILLANSMLLVCMIPTYAGNPKISVKTVSSASVGEIITVSVNLSANSNLGAIDFTVKFNSSEFQPVSGSAKSSSLFLAEVKESENSVKYGGMVADVVNSSGTLLTFKLKVLKTDGKITLTVTEAVDGNDKIVTSSVLTSGATVKCSHANMKWDVVKKATCTVTGEKKGTCSCGYTSTEKIQKTNHTYGKWTIEKQPTEKENGLKWAKCSVCGDKKEQVINKLKPTETTETTTETTTFVENTTESTTNEPTTVPTAPIVEKISTAEIVAKTVAVVLGVEALGLIVFLIAKKKKEKK